VLLYPTADATPLSIPPRSYLHYLQPVGMGQPYVERLTSYISRLAHTHNVRPQTLVVHEILPRFGRDYLSKSSGTSQTTFWAEQIVSFNGTDDWASDCATILEHLTLRQDIRWLTMLPWLHILPPRDLLRRHHAWCPLCYEEWRTAGQTIYDPLLWSLQAVTVCPIHQVPLAQQCPHCQQHELAVLAQDYRPGFCSACQRWLSNLPDPTQKDFSNLQDMAYQCWKAEAAGTLLTCVPTLTHPPERAQFISNITACTKHVTQGNVSKMATRLGYDRTTLRAWQLGKHAPTLGTLLDICYRLGVMPLQFLTEPVDTTKLAMDDSAPMGNRSRGIGTSERSFDVDEMRRLLEHELARDEVPPPSMHEVARRLKRDQSHLAGHAELADVCHRISQRYEEYQQAQKQARIAHLSDQIRAIAYQLNTEDVYPGRDPIEEALEKPGVLREPELNATWRGVLRELGWNGPGKRTSPTTD